MTLARDGVRRSSSDVPSSGWLLGESVVQNSVQCFLAQDHTARELLVLVPPGIPQPVRDEATEAPIRQVPSVLGASWSDPATLDLLAALVRTELVAWWSALDWMASTRLSPQVARLASSAHGVAAGDVLAYALHQGAALATTGIALESALMRTSWLRRAAHTGRTLSPADLDAVTSSLVVALSDNIRAS